LENVSEVKTPIEKKWAKHVYYIYVIRCENRDELRAWLNSKGVSTGIHYPTPIHLQEAYRDLNYSEGSFKITEKYADEILSLPMFPELTRDEIGFISKCIVEFYG
jgi:dTDP-4-amino-4,6-dideoxygalactose transaminase